MDMNRKALRDELRRMNVDPENLTSRQKKAVGTLKEEYDRLSGMDQNKILSELNRMKNDPALKEKLANGQMDDLAKRMQSVLTTEQQRKLQGILQSLKK